MNRTYPFIVFAGCVLALCLIMLAAPARGLTQELLRNSGFEEGTAHWTLEPSTAIFEIISAPVHGGSSAAALTRTAAAGSARIYQELHVRPGQTYVFEGWVLWNDDRISVARLRLKWLDGPSGTQIGDLSEVEAGGRGPNWRLLSTGSVTAPAGASVARVECFTHVSTPDPSSPARALFDDLSFSETTTPRPGLVKLNEFLPAPRNLFSEEWIELYNGGPTIIDLRGWQIRDALDHSYGLCAESIAPGEFLLCSGSFSLNNDGDTIKLVDGHGLVVDTYSYGSTQYDVSWSRTVDGGGVWTDTYPPSPGGPNLPAPDTPTPTVTLTPTPTPTATRYPLAVLLNEFLPSPKDVDWDGNGTSDLYDEWIETQTTTRVGAQHSAGAPVSTSLYSTRLGRSGAA